MKRDIIKACEYHELSANTPVLNLSSLGNYLWARIPVEYKHYQLIDMYDASGNELREVDFFGKIEMDHDHPWIGIPVTILDIHAGKHIYRFNFYDPSTGSYSSLFLSYRAQDDNPVTPYIYMPNRGNTSVENNSWKDGSYAEDFYRDMSSKVDYQVTGYDPLLFGEELNIGNYCSNCVLTSCENCPYKQEEV